MSGASILRVITFYEKSGCDLFEDNHMSIRMVCNTSKSLRVITLSSIYKTSEDRGHAPVFHFT